MCADAIATLEAISPRAADELALSSRQRADIAIRNGQFDKSLVRVYGNDGTPALDCGEFPRPQTTLEGLSALKGGLVMCTAGGVAPAIVIERMR